MTIGELAKMFNAERNINAKLTVVPMEGWQRGDWFDSTGLEWVNPSPNLRSVTEAALYPGVALIEGTNVSVGRGQTLHSNSSALRGSRVGNSRLIKRSGHRGRALCAGDFHSHSEHL